MYVPEAFALSGRAAVHQVLRDFNFALLVSTGEGGLTATHLPFLLDPEAGTRGTLLGHMARANPQWRDFEAATANGREVLVVFAGPHGYVSPNWYGDGPAVPTWNYQAVHVYGVPGVVGDPARVRQIVERLVSHHEQGSGDPWRLDSQDGSYVDRMLRGIVAFEVPISRIDAKAKLSQNRSADDRAGVIAGLERSGRAPDRELAVLMRDLTG